MSIVQFLTNARLETNWLSFRSGPVGDESLQTLESLTEDAFISNSLTSVTSSCCTAIDAGDVLDDAIEEPVCVQSVTGLGVAFDAVLIDGRVGCISPEFSRSLLCADGVVLVQTDDATSSPGFRGYAWSARIGHRLWIASPNETDFAAFVPIRGLIEGNEPVVTENGSDHD